MNVYLLVEDGYWDMWATVWGVYASEGEAKAAEGEITARKTYPKPDNPTYVRELEVGAPPAPMQWGPEA